jgi:hypothetical protein
LFVREDARMTLKDLYALILTEYKGVDPLWLAGHVRWVMDLDHYKQVRAACVEAGAIYPEGNDPEDWVPKPEDQLFALFIDVREDGGAPHLEPVSAGGAG